MAEITAQMVKELRERTGAGMMDCKNALSECKGDIEAAVDALRKKGLAAAAKKAGRVTAEGAVGSYIHAGGKLGVLVEVNCETDFVARTDQFKEFAREVALHVAWAAPLYVSEDDVPQQARDAELRILKEQAAADADGKPEHIQQKMAEGRLQKWLEEVVLLDQRHANEEKHGGKTIEELRAETAAATGENIVIRRFTRFSLGEE
jgi:elongation factor Ts